MRGTDIDNFLQGELLKLASEDCRVFVNDTADGPMGWVNVSVLFRKSVDGVQTTLETTFVVHWISEHLWRVEINSPTHLEVVTEIDPFAAFYMAVGLGFVNS